MTDEELDHSPLGFGKYKGLTPNQVAEKDSSYLVWMHDTVTNRPTCSRLLRNECVKVKPGKPAYTQPAERDATYDNHQLPGNLLDDDEDDVPF